MRTLLAFLLSAASCFGFGGFWGPGKVQSFNSLPLDCGVTNTYGAYSVARKLSWTYQGNGIRIREDGGNNETNIAFLNGIIDSAGIASWCGANNGFITTIYEQSGGDGTDFTQVTASAQPQIYDGSAVSVSSIGRVLAEFDGSNDRMKIINDAGHDQPVSRVMAWEQKTWVSGDTISDGGSSFSVLQQSPSADRYRIFAGSGLNNTTTVVSNAYTISICIYDGASSLISINGNETSGDAGATDPDGMTIGAQAAGGSPGHVGWHEAVVFERSLATVERQTIKYSLDHFYRE